jgi:alpha-ketoglutarate-dependent 2,4-dichlorophenoxyacetate dioxygenase
LRAATDSVPEGFTKLTIVPLETHIAAEVRGLDAASPQGEETFAELRRALYRHSVLVFHDQDISDQQQVAFTRGFGRLQMTMASDPYGGGGPINRIANVDEEGRLIPPEDSRSLYQAGNMLWHSDGSFKAIPLRASMLSAKVVPPHGGETEYASLRAAYAALPEPRQAQLERLVAEHSMAYSRAQIAHGLMSDAFRKETPPVRQVLVRTIPETGEKALYVGSYASHIIGWEREKGSALLEELLEWSTQPRFVYRHRWKTNDLVMWDNRTCLHRGRSWDNRVYKRIMHRTTLAGDGPTVA